MFCSYNMDEISKKSKEKQTIIMFIAFKTAYNSQYLLKTNPLHNKPDLFLELLEFASK